MVHEHKITHCGGHAIKPEQAYRTTAFTRTDLIFTVGIVLLLGVLLWIGISVGSEKRRIWVCAHHLKLLGQAFTEYAVDHGNALPPAVLADGRNSTSWDNEIAPYLEPGLRKPALPESQKTLKSKIAWVFKCPSDRELRGGLQARSYSMPMYDINRVGWPPTIDSQGGLGLYLDAKTIKKARAADETQPSDYMPAIKISMIPDPSDTALLVERISILNALWASKYACITSTKEQFDAKTFSSKEFHGGKMNYLMLDGHVELLSPAQSAGFTGGNGGVWTIQQGD